jgi:hypothetical protein
MPTMILKTVKVQIVGSHQTTRDLVMTPPDPLTIRKIDLNA